MRTALPRPVAWLLALALALTGLGVVAAPTPAAGAGLITGIITTSDQGYVSTRVTAYLKVGDAWDLFSTTEASGSHYVISGLPTGTYRLLFEGDPRYYAPEYYNNASSLEMATDVAVTSGAVTSGTNVQLTPAGVITGTVTGLAGQQFSTIEITVYLLVGADWKQFRVIKTSNRGRYRIDGLPTGTYRLRFRGDFLYNDSGDSQRGDYQAEYWNDAASLEAAQDIAVWGGMHYSDIDAELAEAGDPRIRSTSLPTISGTAQAGSTLTASTGSWDPSTGLSFDYEWWAGGRMVATGPSYTPIDYVGSPVRVTVTASKDGYRPRRATSEATADLEIGPAPVFHTQPTISGTPRVGATVAATPGAWTPTGGSSHIVWLVDDVVKFYGPEYTPAPADAGKSLRARTTARAPWAAATLASSPSMTIEKGTLKALSNPRLKGRVKKNATLSVFVGSWSPGAARHTVVQWYAGGKPIARATSTGLKLRGRTLRTVVGKKIKATVTINLPGYESVVTTLTAPGKVKR